MQLFVSALINVKKTANASRVLTCYFNIGYMSEILKKKQRKRHFARPKSKWKNNITLILGRGHTVGVWTELMWLSIVFIRSPEGTC